MGGPWAGGMLVEERWGKADHKAVLQEEVSSCRLVEVDRTQQVDPP